TTKGPPRRTAPVLRAMLERACRLDAELLRNQLAVVVRVAPRELALLLAAVEELDLVVLGEADAAVDLLAVGDHAARGVRSPGLRHVHGQLLVSLVRVDGPRGLVHDEARAV